LTTTCPSPSRSGRGVSRMLSKKWRQAVYSLWRKSPSQFSSSHSNNR
jgi:hypothetical protein